MKRTKPPFRADHVGSFLRPAALKEARAKREKGAISAAELKAVEDREIEKVVKKQEELGLQLASDGEFRRSWWHFDFLGMLDGVEIYEAEQGIQFRGVQTKAQGLRIVGKVGFSDHPMLAHFKFLKAHSKVTPKMTIPAPPVLHFRLAKDGIKKSVYPDLDQFFHDLGNAYKQAVKAFYDAGCRYLQFDDTVWAYLCSQEELQIAATGVVERLHCLLVGIAEIVEELIEIGIDAFLDAVLGQAEMQHRRRGDGHLRRDLAVGFEKLEVRQHRMVGKADLAHDAQPLRLGLHATELDALLGLVNLDPVEHAEEVEVPPGAAELAVGRKLKAEFLLLLDDLFDLAVLDRLELGGGNSALFALCARLFERRGGQEAADMIGAERRFGSLHRSGSLGVIDREQRHGGRRVVNHKTTGELSRPPRWDKSHLPWRAARPGQCLPLRRDPAAVTPR